jgi:hypothetical protein
MVGHGLCYHDVHTSVLETPVIGSEISGWRRLWKYRKLIYLLNKENGLRGDLKYILI